tara:strand:+ start:13556 stop:13768 length:213 start_codon:yes stop_codon:yes gene_type:complete
MRLRRLGHATYRAGRRWAGCIRSAAGASSAAVRLTARLENVVEAGVELGRHVDGRCEVGVVGVMVSEGAQ